MVYKIASKINIKRGSPYAESIAEQSYLYRLGYVWINVLMSEDKRGLSTNPFSWSTIDFCWSMFFFVASVFYILYMIGYSPWKALSLGTVRPIEFWGDIEPSTSYQYSRKWYFDNGKIRT